MKPHRLAAGVATLAVASLLALAPTVPAAAEPSTPVSYPAAATATRLNGYAFDACDAPTAATMRAWTASPFDGVGVYIGGANRTCRQANLTASWVTTVSVGGWKIIPIYMGRQAPCTTRPNSVEFTAAGAALAGTEDAADAVAKAKALGMLPGSAIYGDMEHYVATDTACRDAVLRYVSSWTKELHRQGYLAGVYAGLTSGAKHLSDAYGSTSYARPDALWIARWDGNASLTGWAGIPNDRWANMQRGKQYRGDHNETHGGVTINIDSDRFDAPVATVAHPYRVTGSSPLTGRSAPTASAPATGTYAAGSTIQVVCQTWSATVGSTAVWDKLSDGRYVSDAFVSTPSSSYTAILPRCVYPYQVTAGTLNARTGPGTTYAISRTLPAGALAWVTCQTTGTKVGTTSVWDRLHHPAFVSDAHVATPSGTTFSSPIRRC